LIEKNTLCAAMEFSRCTPPIARAVSQNSAACETSRST